MTRFLRACAMMLALLAGPPAALARAQPSPAAAAPVVRPALWKIAGRDTTIYLFGTIHLLPADVRWLHGPVAQAVAQADTLVTEILEPTPDATRAVLAAQAMLPPGPSLRDTLAPADRAALVAALATQHLPPSALDRFQPWFAAITLATTPMLQLGYDPASGVDVQLGRLAQARGMPHEALETMAFQLGLFANLPRPIQTLYLHQVIAQLPQVPTELAQVIRAWKAGQAGDLAQLMNADQDDPQMMQVLLFDRNRTWAQWIKTRLAHPGKPHETLFIAVGAGHLAGPGSVQDDLRALGIASQRVQ